jgi:uncharacterized membrane protein
LSRFFSVFRVFSWLLNIRANEVNHERHENHENLAWALYLCPSFLVSFVFFVVIKVWANHEKRLNGQFW